ncbi:MAG: beta-Ala-His dipeptidase [Candidatus Hodarchaeales archaeon]|jgi:dipeptidase D
MQKLTIQAIVSVVVVFTIFFLLGFAKLIELQVHQSAVLENLDPAEVWELFEEISHVPRESQKEEKIRTWIQNWANKHSISWKEDTAGNLLLSQQASVGFENYPGIILQAHLDMVALKSPESSHDFENDPIPLQVVNNEYVTADGTTLGADNGIGIAIALATLVNSTFHHGPIEVLLTVDEEKGLSGAFSIEPGFFSHILLLNLDSEEKGAITISSAGGGATTIALPISWEQRSVQGGLKLTVSGLTGGHSGVDIDKPRLNAIKILSEGLTNLSTQVDLDISSLNGGTVSNAIPTDASCEFSVNDSITAQNAFQNWKITLTSYQAIESQMNVELTNITLYKSANTLQTNSILSLLQGIPHGPLNFSKEVSNLVETSNNLAIVKTTSQGIECETLTRSSIGAELERVRSDIEEFSKNIGAQVTQHPTFPAWPADVNSSFLQLVHQIYEQEYQQEVELKAVHAGLETGVFKGIDSELQLVSIGPDIRDVHTTQERIYIQSVALIWRVVRAILTNLDQL